MQEQNKSLIDEVIYWLNNTLAKAQFFQKYNVRKNNRNKQKLSHPFYVGLSHDYLTNKNKKRIMIIGRETKGYGKMDDGTAEYSFLPDVTLRQDMIEDVKCSNRADLSQHWALAYLAIQLSTDEPDINLSEYAIERNHSPFWNALRQLHKKYAICWNNLDKTHYNNISDKSHNKEVLTEEVETELSAPYQKDGETESISLLVREIIEAKPDLVVFFTGESYKVSMKTALGSNADFAKVPCADDDTIVDITAEANLFNGTTSIPVIWTMHPGEWLQKKIPNDFQMKKLIETIEKLLAKRIEI